MAMTPDDVFAEMQHIREEQSNLDPDSAEFRVLENRREQLVSVSRSALDGARNRQALQTELAHLEARLAAIDNDKIEVPSWQTAMASRRFLTINDPAAATENINAELDKNTEPDRNSITARIEQLKTALQE